MVLQKLVLRQFRNYSQIELKVEPKVNLFLGSNGSGKTNLIEAIYVLVTGVSPRGTDAENMIEWNQNGFFIRGEFSRGEFSSSLTLEMKYQRGIPRVIRQNDRTAVRLRDLLGRVPIVSFFPEDLSLVKGEPDLRRRAINMILMQVDPTYAEILKRYNEALKSRNAALRQLGEGKIPQDVLASWDQAVIQAGLVLFERRNFFITDFSPFVNRIHGHVSNDLESVQMEYRPSLDGPWDPSAKKRWQEKMVAHRDQEIALGATLVGPHRDDVHFLINGRSARTFASEGQKRTCAVAFKLAEIPYIQEKLNQKPICLLDDVLSELDAGRAERLLSKLSQTGQCFVTMTGLESWPPQCEKPASIYQVDDQGVHLMQRYSHPHSPELAVL